MRTFTDKELELTPKVAEVMGWEVEHCDGIVYSQSIWFPLEHDCLEWLRERVKNIQMVFGGSDWHIFVGIETKRAGRGFTCDTLLEALYKVILEVGND